MKFSIIIPVYNVKDYLAKCVDSILVQDCRDCEMILVDDGSTDGASGPLCDDYAAAHPELIRVIHQENQGLGGARNTGIEAAAGEYLLLVDSDDYLAPETLEQLRAVVGEYSSDIVTFGFVMDENGRLTERHLDNLPEGRVFTLGEVKGLLLAAPNAWNRLWKRSLFLESGIRFPKRVWYEDIRTTTKLFALAKSIVYVPETFYRYVVREGSITRNVNVERSREILDAFEDLLGWYQQQGLFETYYQELSRLTVDHVYLAASVRVLRIDPKHPLLREFLDFVWERFPDFQENPYLRQLPRQHKLLIKLLKRKQYGIIRLMFQIKDHLH